MDTCTNCHEAPENCSCQDRPSAPPTGSEKSALIQEIRDCLMAASAYAVTKPDYTRHQLEEARRLLRKLEEIV